MKSLIIIYSCFFLESISIKTVATNLNDNPNETCNSFYSKWYITISLDIMGAKIFETLTKKT